MQQAKQLKLIFGITIIVISTILAIMFFKTEGILNDSKASSQQQEKTNISILTSDVVVDQSWGSLAYKGKIKIEEQFPVAAELYSEVNTEQLMKETVQQAVKAGSQIIIGHGREFSEVFTNMAPNYPDVHFVTIHGTSKHSNQSVYTFNQQKIEYYAALTAAVKTKTNKVGLLDVHDVRNKLKGFEQGLQHYKPEAELYYRFVNDRNDGKKAIQLMKELIDNGADVIYSKGNGYNRDVINYAKERNVYVIGFLDDQSYMGKQHVLTSVLNDVPQAYVCIMEDFFENGELPSGQVLLDESDGVYKLAPIGPMYTEKEKQYINSEFSKHNNGDFYLD